MKEQTDINSNNQIDIIDYPLLDKEMFCSILLASFNGEKFLSEQLESIRKQKYRNLKIYISDDGSIDHTHKIIAEHIILWGEKLFRVLNGPQTGFCNNFMSLIYSSTVESGFFAFSDQDDIWAVDKLSRAINKLKEIPLNTPALYCSRSELISQIGAKIGLSPLFKKKPCFQNALIQCIAGGNTMVMNKAARDLLIKAKEESLVSHDWWSYMLISGAGGVVIYDPHPTIFYRQHNSNVYGRNNSWIGRLQRIRMLFQGVFHNWNTINCHALQQNRHLLTTQNQKILDSFCAARQRWLIPRLYGIWQSGIYRQTILGNLGLFVAALFNKL